MQGKHPASALRSAQGTVWGERDGTQVGKVQGKHPASCPTAPNSLTRARFTRHSSRYFCACSAVRALKTYMMGGWWQWQDSGGATRHSLQALAQHIWECAFPRSRKGPTEQNPSPALQAGLPEKQVHRAQLAPDFTHAKSNWGVGNLTTEYPSRIPSGGGVHPSDGDVSGGDPTDLPNSAGCVFAGHSVSPARAQSGRTGQVSAQVPPR